MRSVFESDQGVEDDALAGSTTARTSNDELIQKTKQKQSGYFSTDPGFLQFDTNSDIWMGRIGMNGK